MKILICSSEYYPKGSGIANVAYYVAQELKKKGHSITVLSTDCGDINFKEYESRISKFGGLALIGFWEKARKCIIASYEDYDLFWVHNPLFLRKIKPNKIFATIHTTYVQYAEIYKTFPYPWHIKQYYKVMKLIEKYCYKKNKFNVNVISPALIDEALNLGAKNPTYIPNGVDTDKFKLSEKKFNALTNKMKILLCVGRVTYQKSPFKLIRTLKEIEKINDKICLIWAGTGELIEDTKKLIKELNCKNVRMLGPVPHEKLPGLFAKATAYILASCYEGQPLTVLESLSTGTPCILSNIPNLTHIIEESGVGIIVDFNKNDRAQRIINYLEKTDFKKESQRARKFALESLDWSIIAEKYEKIWSNILKVKQNET